MELRATVPDATVTIAKRDLIEAWSALEKVVVSLHRIGSNYATPSAQHEQTPEQRAEMLDQLDQFLSGDVLRELGRARRVLSDYIPDEEAEYISDNVIRYWTSKTAAARSSTNQKLSGE